MKPSRGALFFRRVSLWKPHIDEWRTDRVVVAFVAILHQSLAERSGNDLHGMDPLKTGTQIVKKSKFCHGAVIDIVILI